MSSTIQSQDHKICRRFRLNKSQGSDYVDVKLTVRIFALMGSHHRTDDWPRPYRLRLSFVDHGFSGLGVLGFLCGAVQAYTPRASDLGRPGAFARDCRVTHWCARLPGVDARFLEVTLNNKSSYEPAIRLLLDDKAGSDELVVIGHAGG